MSASAVPSGSSARAAEGVAALGAAAAAGSVLVTGAGASADIVMENTERAFCAEDDETLTVSQHMIAGAIAGMTEHLVMFPVDTVKTRMQSYTGVRDYSNGKGGVFRAMRSIHAQEGFRALWRGAGAVALSAGPAHALYFASYEAIRSRLESRGYKQLAPGLAGVASTVVLDAIMTPLDVVKQRMQLNATKHTSVSSCIRNVFHTQGISAFFAGYRATLIMNIPFHAVYFTAYETAKKYLISTRQYRNGNSLVHNNNEVGGFSASLHCLAGAGAGAAAAAATNPLDVVKTRLQTQGEVGARRYMGMAHALKAIAVEEGTSGLMRGVRARMMFHAPAAAVCWTTYEFFKHTMDPNNSNTNS